MQKGEISILVDNLLQSQIATWEMAKTNYAALDDVRVKKFTIDGITLCVQYNAARIASSAAKTDAQSIKERKCFLCKENRPTQQLGIEWGNDYEILVNPFPIFPRHLTIPCRTHTIQSIKGRIADMFRLAEDLPDFDIFYNGPKCGASAPDHMHFQAGNKGFMPFFDELNPLQMADCGNGVKVTTQSKANCTAIVLQSATVEAAEAWFNKLISLAPHREGEIEPRLNLLCRKEAEGWLLAVFLRTAHRPTCFYAEGDERLLISPASVDMGGVFITPIENDFEKVTASDLSRIYKEVCISSDEALKICKQLKD